jgi:hypothetical protein
VNRDRFIWWAGQAFWWARSWGPVTRWVRGLGRVGSGWCKLAWLMDYAEPTPMLSIGAV